MEAVPPCTSRTVVTPQARYRGGAQVAAGLRWAWASISPGMIQRPETSTSRVLRGNSNPPRSLTDSMRPRRTTTTASRIGGPPLPSISVAPTSAIPSLATLLQPRNSRAARARLQPWLARITGGVIVENLPSLGPLFHHQRERAAGGDLRAALEDEAGCHQGKRGAEGSDLDLLEVEAVPPGTRSKPRRIDATDVVE